MMGIYADEGGTQAVATLVIFILRQREIRGKLAKIPQNHVAIRPEDVPKVRVSPRHFPLCRTE
jgi:hypothetical protein